VEDGSDLSQRILSAARELFFERGFERTQLRAIAAKAGTSESGILRVYHSKDGLLRAVYAWCWAEINDLVDEAMARVRQDDADPRDLLLELARTVLGFYHAYPAWTSFMLGHFGQRATSGLGDAEGVDARIDTAVKNEYHRYLQRIFDLCSAIADTHPCLERGGVTRAALAEVVTSILYGVQTSWHMADQDRGALHRVTLDEALSALRFFLYPENLDQTPGVRMRQNAAAGMSVTK